MLHQSLAGLALLLSLATHSPNQTALGVHANAAASAAATASISGKVVENISGTALVSGTFIYVGRMKVQPAGSGTAFAVLYLWQGPGDPAGAPAEITASTIVRVRGALTIDTEGHPLIVASTVDSN